MRSSGCAELHRRAAYALCAGLLVASVPWAAAPAFELGGQVALESRIFAHSPLDPRQHGDNLSLALEPEFDYRWDDGRQSVSFVPFLRLDQGDRRRSHFDVRELTWLTAADTWELRAGVRKVFWGVAESEHLVDIINQTDLVEDIDGEQKLGQPMLNLALIRDWGTLDFFVLPYFRTRTFPGRAGRLRTQPRIDSRHPRFESGAKRHHLDLALRWSASIGDVDVGIAHFRGTSREPRLLLGRDGGGSPVLVPFYEQIHQTSLDLQATTGQWLWKLEALTRSGQGRTFSAFIGGFEYTFVGALGSAADLGVLAEYAYDDRARQASSPFQDDVFTGLRLSLNDAASSTALAGVITDRLSGAQLYSLEASRRLGDRWKLSLVARAITRPAPSDPLRGLRKDDYVQLTLARYF